METATQNKALMASGVKLAKKGEVLLPEGNRYAALVGSSLYLSITTRPDIAFAVGLLSRIMSCPEQAHMHAAMGVLRYLRGTTRLDVVYGGRPRCRGLSTPTGRATLTTVGRRQASSLPSMAGPSRG